MGRTDRFGVEVRERTMWDIRTGVVGADTFVPKHVVIATWKNVSFAGGIDNSLFTVSARGQMNIKWMILIFTFCAADKHLPNGARHRWSLHLCHLELCGPQLAFTHWGRRWYHQGRGRSSSIRKSLGNPELLSVVSRSHCRFGSHLIKHFAQKEIHLHISHTHTHARCKHRNVHYWRLPSNGKVFVGFLFVADFDSLHISNISLMF